MRDDDGYNPTEVTAKRGAKLWRKALENPVFDNGDPSETGFMGAMMTRMIKVNTTPELLDKFEVELAKRIMTPEGRGYYRSAQLSCDYGPCPALDESAVAVGLDCQFPWKTHMHIYGDRISFSQGYGAPYEQHYLLEDGRWLVTSCDGPDIDKIKRYLVHGEPLEFKVQDDELNPLEFAPLAEEATRD